MFFLQTCPSALYLLTGLMYLRNYSSKIYRVEIKMSDDDDRKARLRWKRRGWGIGILVLIAIYATCYSGSTFHYCLKKDEQETYHGYWMAYTTTIFYILTFIVLTIRAKHEWTWMNH